MKKKRRNLMKVYYSLMFLAVVIASACAEDKSAPTAQPGQSVATVETSGGLNWMTDFEAAKEKAKAEKKHLLLDFTGSDWCGWCKKLDKEVFSTQAFKDFADANLILVQVDFPRRKPQSDAVKAQNQKLQGQYRVEGYPTLVVLDSTGKEVGQTGYREGGGEAYVKHLQGFLPKSAK